MKITFILHTGATIDVVIPEEEQAGFNFAAAVANTRLNGFFQSANVHVRYDAVSCMMFATDEIQAPVLRKDLQ
jgi:hypothetical protein